MLRNFRVSLYKTAYRFTYVFIFFIVLTLLVDFNTLESQKQKYQPYIKINSKFNHRFSPELSIARLNRLLKILHDNEPIYESVLQNLNVVSFKQLIETNLSNAPEDYKNNLKINNGRLEAKNEFIEYLINQSVYGSFNDPKKDSSNNHHEDSSVVIVMAGDHKYFQPLVEAIENVKLNFKNMKLIVYDIGMTKKNKEKVCTQFFWRLF